MKLRTLTIACAAALFAGPALAQDWIRAECRPATPLTRFDDQQHGLWYQRFWSGQCPAGLPGGLFGCQASNENWNALVGQVAARAPAARRAAVVRRVCALGPRIGREWARDNGVRRINTSDLYAFYATLEQASDVEAGLTRVEATVNARLGAS